MEATLKRLIDQGGSVVAPGVGDALGAKLVTAAGFECVYMSGYYVAATFGYPDVGLVTLTEMTTQAARICASVSVPVIADADNGHGNVINLMRTVREFEKAGVSAIHLEDQDLPKRCGDLALSSHVKLISSVEMCMKIDAAIKARHSSDFMIIARSDAAGVVSLDDAIRRAKAYRSSGADAIMLQGPRSFDDLMRIRAEVEGPLVVTVGGWKFPMTVKSLQDAGFQIVLYPLAALRRGTAAIQDCLKELKTSGAIDHDAKNMITMHDLHHAIGMDEILAQEKQLLADAKKYQ
jgi:2-methylisocitrate lyase-like PEP mutase family enzyme